MNHFSHNAENLSLCNGGRGDDAGVGFQTVSRLEESQSRERPFNWFCTSKKKKWYATAFNMDVTLLQSAFCLQTAKSILLKLLHILKKAHITKPFCQEPAIFKSMFIALFILQIRDFSQISAICTFLRHRKVEQLYVEVRALNGDSEKRKVCWLNAARVSAISRVTLDHGKNHETQMWCFSACLMPEQKQQQTAHTIKVELLYMFQKTWVCVLTQVNMRNRTRTGSSGSFGV